MVNMEDRVVDCLSNGMELCYSRFLKGVRRHASHIRLVALALPDLVSKLLSGVLFSNGILLPPYIFSLDVPHAPLAPLVLPRLPRCSPLLPRCSLNTPPKAALLPFQIENGNPQSNFGVYIIYICKSVTKSSSDTYRKQLAEHRC